jgi:hypothetical protein
MYKKLETKGIYCRYRPLIKKFSETLLEQQSSFPDKTIEKEELR